MLTSFIQKTLLVFMVTSSLVLTACGNKEESPISDRGQQPATNTAHGAASPTPSGACGGDSTKVVGRIYNKANDRNQFVSSVRKFVSATLNPDEIGDISPSMYDQKTGVELLAHFEFDGDGNLMPTESTVKITIVDSFVGVNSGGHVIEPYAVEFTRAKEGYFDKKTNWISVLFEDNYGSITIEGRISADKKVVDGNVKFVNKTAVSGFSPASGVLGQFQMYTCAMIAGAQ